MALASLLHLLRPQDKPIGAVYPQRCLLPKVRPLIYALGEELPGALRRSEMGKKPAFNPNGRDRKNELAQSLTRRIPLSLAMWFGPRISFSKEHGARVFRAVIYFSSESNASLDTGRRKAVPSRMLTPL